MRSVLLVACVAALHSSALAQERFTSRQYGFELTPPAGWACYGADGSAPVLYQVAAFPRDAQGVPSLLVQVLRWGGTPDAAGVRDLGAASVAGKPGYGPLRKGERELLGERWPTLACDLTAPDGRALALECVYVTAPGFAYALTTTRPRDDGPARERLEALLASFALRGGEEEARLREQAARCGAQLPWASNWEAAAARAKAEGRLVLVVYEVFSILELPHTIASGALSDPDVAALCQERLVVLRLQSDDPAPFRAPERYGLSRWSWGASILFVTPAGQVLREASGLDPVCVDEVARQALAAVPLADGPPAGSLADPEEAAALALRRGELERAVALVAGRRTARAHRVRAEAHRRKREGQAALAELAAARAAGPAPALRRQLDADEALVRLRLGDLEGAAQRFSAIAAEPDHPRRGEALFWLGTLHVLGHPGDLSGGEFWRRAVAELPEDPWAWKAAANLLRTGALLNGAELIAWPDPAALAASLPIPGAPASPDQAEQAEAGARAFLLAAQRPDGSWGCPSEDLSLVRAGYGVAVTSICATSLLPRAGEPAVARAIERGLAWVAAARSAGALAGGRDLGGSYKTWGRAYALRLLVRCLQAGVGDPAALRAQLATLIPEVCARQVENGGWPYVSLSTDPSGDGMASSFLSAAVLLTLCEAKQLGLEVPAQTLAKGAAFLRSLRDEDGTFRYAPDVKGHVRGEDRPEAAGRSPLCALALHRALLAGGGQGDLAGIRRALEVFLAHRAVLEAQRGKDLCHTGPDGQASYYFAFDHAYAAEAVQELPPAERARFADPIQAGILAARCQDGSFLDMPALGRPYATGMLLGGLEALRPE